MSSLAAAPARTDAAPFKRGEMAAALMLALGLGGLAPVVVTTFRTEGLAALPNGGGISWVVWLALGLAVRLALKAPAAPANRTDWAFAAVCVASILAPAHVLINLAATALGLRYALSPGSPKELRGAGVILVALFVSVFWAIHITPAFAEPLARVDAWWVGLISGTAVQGNIVSFADGNGSFLLAGACTSLANASLALLLWISILRSARPQGARGEWLAAVGVLASVMAVNIVRLALMSRDLEIFDRLHGSAAVAMVVTATGLAWGVWGARRELFA